MQGTCTKKAFLTSSKLLDTATWSAMFVIFYSLCLSSPIKTFISINTTISNYWLYSTSCFAKIFQSFDLGIFCLYKTDTAVFTWIQYRYCVLFAEISTKKKNPSEHCCVLIDISYFRFYRQLPFLVSTMVLLAVCYIYLSCNL